MTDIKSLWGRVKAEDAKTGYVAHPVGTYNGIVTGIEEKEYEGKAIYEMIIQTDVGIAKHGIWDLDEADYEKVGEERFLATLARYKKLVVDLGQVEPGSYEEWLRALGNTVGSSCSIKVVASNKKPGEVIVFVNAPSDITMPPTRLGQNRGIGVGGTVSVQRHDGPPRKPSPAPTRSVY